MRALDAKNRDIGVVLFMTTRNEAAVKLKRQGRAHIIFVGRDYIRGTCENANDKTNLFPPNHIALPGWTLYAPEPVTDLAKEFEAPFRIEA